MITRRYKFTEIITHRRYSYGLNQLQVGSVILEINCNLENIHLDMAQKVLMIVGHPYWQYSVGNNGETGACWDSIGAEIRC